MSTQLPPAVYREQVQGTLKWFNQTKGFGFVEIEGEEQDAFLHATLVDQDHLRRLGPGVSLVCDLAKGQRGLVINQLHSMDFSTVRPEQNNSPRRFENNPHDKHQDDDLQGPSQTLEGIVKFYNSGKGYGFLLPDGGGEDVFLPGRVVQASGLHHIEPNTRLRVEAREGPRGLQAQSVTLIQEG